MSYHRPSFRPSYSTMSRGRGSYSSRSRGSSWSSSRGSYGSRGGGGGSGSSSSSSRFDPPFSSSFSERPKYSSSSDRYSSSRGHDEFRKPYRTDSYSSHRDSHRSSPDRKRNRTEAPSSRHESSYGGGGSGGGSTGYGSSSRYESSSYSNRRSFSSDRHHPSSSSSSFSRRSDEFRRPSGPPRGGYRGRISSRGSRGLKIRDHPPRRRLLESSSYAVRRRIIPSRTSDYARRLKISKMRSAIAARSKKRSSDKDDSDGSSVKKDNKTDNSTKEQLEIKKNEKNDEIINKNNDDTIQQKKNDKETTNIQITSDKDEKSDKNDGGVSPSQSRKSFIKLNCPHCGLKAVTFRKYDLHLQSRVHLMAMRKIAVKQKSILAQMRLAQRNTQNELEKTSDDLTSRTNFCPLCKLNYKQRKAVHQSSEAHKNMKKFLMPYCKICNSTFKSPMIYESHCCSIEHLKRKQRVENGDESVDDDDDDNLENFTTIDSVGVDENISEDDDKKEPINVGIEQVRKVDAYYCDLCKMYLNRCNEDEVKTLLSKHCKQRTHLQRYVRYKEDKELEKRAEKLQRKETAEKLEIKKERQEKETNGLDDFDDENGNDNGSGSGGASGGVGGGIGGGTSAITTTTTLTTTPSASSTTISIHKRELKDNSDKDDESINKVLDDEEARDDKLWADVDKDLDDILAKESGNKSSDEDEDVTSNERYDSRFKYSKKEVIKNKKDSETDGLVDSTLNESVEVK